MHRGFVQHQGIRHSTYDIDKLREFEFEPDGEFLRVVANRSDQAVVVAQKVVVETLGKRIRLRRAWR